ncbi:MAG TPA: tRNA (adenosine(37)-N6)-dimethylallyltransferase MiaA [Clostridiales bacterium]|nr:tRNA (adenosine(37)-N6)-dimethylallyltransferase MiaA [Clostridiales bacterium]
MEKQKLMAIIGPTATGKSELAVLLAKALNGEVISADSAQVYRGLNIGSAKISEGEKQGIRHHLLDIVSPKTDYNVGLFQKDAKAAIAEIAAKRKLPILCGGSGLYVNAVINSGYQLGQETAQPLQRKELLALEAEKGEGFLYAMVREKFPNRAAKIHPHDYQRILRALEMTEDSDAHEENSWESPYTLSLYGLTMDREALYRRIESRVELMFEKGLVEEVRSLLQTGCKEQGNAMSALGYKEILPYLSGERNLLETKELLKRNTRHFAKRQLTWFRRDPRIIWFDVLREGGNQSIAEKIILLEKNSSS